MYNHFFKETSIQGSVFECEALSPSVAQQHNTYLLDGKNLHTYMILFILTGKTLTPQVMPHIYPVALFSQDALCPSLEKQWFAGWPGCKLGPECRSPRLETTRKGAEFSDEGEKLWDGRQRKSIPTPRNLASPGGQFTDQYNMEQCHAPHSSLRSEPRELRETLLKELSGLHLITRQWEHPPRRREQPMPFTVSWANMPVKARIVRYLRTIFNWKADANVSQWKRLRRKRNNVGRK